jgi:hypothetical protein
LVWHSLALPYPATRPYGRIRLCFGCEYRSCFIVDGVGLELAEIILDHEGQASGDDNVEGSEEWVLSIRS